MEKKEKINDLVFKEVVTYLVEDANGKEVLATGDAEVFNKKKLEAQAQESSLPGGDISAKIELKEQEALTKIASVLDEKINSVMSGNVSRLSRESGVTTVSIANLRKGEGNPGLGSLVRIFTALNVELADVFK